MKKMKIAHLNIALGIIVIFESTLVPNHKLPLIVIGVLGIVVGAISLAIKRKRDEENI